MYVCCTGLFVTLAFWEKDFTDNIIYKKLLSDKLDANLGYVYENIAAQMLAASGNKLYYYTWPAPKNHFYEIDFLLSRGSKLCPVEVKSSGYNTHTSLDEFCKKYSNRVKERYLVYTKDLRKDKETMLVPMYMVPFCNHAVLSFAILYKQAFGFFKQGNQPCRFPCDVQLCLQMKAGSILSLPWVITPRLLVPDAASR